MKNVKKAVIAACIASFLMSAGWAEEVTKVARKPVILPPGYDQPAGRVVNLDSANDAMAIVKDVDVKITYTADDPLRRRVDITLTGLPKGTIPVLAGSPIKEHLSMSSDRVINNLATSYRGLRFGQPWDGNKTGGFDEDARYVRFGIVATEQNGGPDEYTSQKTGTVSKANDRPYLDIYSIRSVSYDRARGTLQMDAVKLSPADRRNELSTPRVRVMSATTSAGTSVAIPPPWEGKVTAVFDADYGKELTAGQKLKDIDIRNVSMGTEWKR